MWQLHHSWGGAQPLRGTLHIIDLLERQGMSWLVMYRMLTVYWNVIWESFCCVKYTLYLKFLWNIYPTQFSDDEGTPPNLKCSSATTNEKKKKKNDQYKRKFPEWLQKKWETFRPTTAHTLSPLLFFFAGHLMLVSSHTAVRVSCWFLDFLILLLVSFTLTPFALFTTECILFHLSIVIYFFKMQINEESCLALSLYQHDT